MGIAIDARNVTLPCLKPPLGTGSAVCLSKRSIGPFEPRGTLSDALARWRDAGGALEISVFALDWEALSIRGDGTFALDEKLQPQGAMTAEIDGVEKTSDALIAAGVIDARTAFAAKVANRCSEVDRCVCPSASNDNACSGPAPLLRLKPTAGNRES